MEATTSLAEVRALRIRVLEAQGNLDPACKGCEEFYHHYRERWEPGQSGPFAPSHLASACCRSGKRNHCTCDSCF